MYAILNLFNTLISIYIWLLIASVVLSWLIAFNVISTGNPIVYQIRDFLYRITEPEKTVYRIRDVDAAIATTVAGIVRAEIGTMDLDHVQSNRSVLIGKIRDALIQVVDVAQPPELRSGPRRVRITAVAALVGLLAACAYVVGKGLRAGRDDWPGSA